MATNTENFPKIKVLIIDDDPKLCRLIKDYLESMGYEIDIANTGPIGLDKALKEDFQAILLDVMLPGIGGFEVLRQIRLSSNVPVLMLTALGDESYRVVGLESGADDYLPKTFSTRELLARLRAVTRRSQLSSIKIDPENPSEIIIRDLRIIPASRKAVLNDQVLALTPVEFDLVLCLARAADRILTRDQLLDAISGRDYEVFDRSIDVHISSLRRKLGDDPKNPLYIKTVRSAGYMLMRSAEA
jgi:DNA-binding response OmpR family regulator